jgi:hypothetical protein
VLILIIVSPASRLRYLSVAHNALGGQGMCDLLLALPCHVLRHLDVTSTVLNKSSVMLAMEGMVNYMDKVNKNRFEESTSMTQARGSHFSFWFPLATQTMHHI